jgi:TCP-1/cpn60 chaperonin family/Tripartite tricarboxylate transporter family receptor
VKERKDRVDDAMHATRAAVEEGMVPSGSVALLRASEHLKGLRTKNDDQKTGLEIVRKALSWPARQIAINAGEDGSVIKADDNIIGHSAIGIKPTMVPFTGTAPVLNAMLGGQIDYECDPVLGTLSQVQAGGVKALAVAARKRCRMCRLLMSRACPNSTVHRFTRCSRRMAHRSQLLGSSRKPSTKALARSRCKSDWQISAPIS